MTRLKSPSKGFEALMAGKDHIIAGSLMHEDSRQREQGFA
jgi:hypothetical protein